MFPELFRIPVLDLPVFGYGFMLIVGFLVAVQVGMYLARRKGVNPEVLSNAAYLALVTGVVGARLSHVLENLSDFTRSDLSFTQNLWNAINISRGGLTFYGGFLLAFPTLVLYAVWKKVPLRVGMDVVAPALMIGLGFGRIGCFFYGCCYGAPCELPWAVRFPYASPAYFDHVAQGRVAMPPELLWPRSDGQLVPMDDTDIRRVEQVRQAILAGKLVEAPAHIVQKAQQLGHHSLAQIAAHEHAAPVHPAQFYSVLNSFLIAALLYAYITLPHAAGRGFALMLMLEGSTRFLLELLRAEPAVLGPMSISMIIALGLTALGAMLWLAFGHLPQQLAVEPKRSAAATAA